MPTALWEQLRRATIARDGPICRACGKVVHLRRCRRGGCPSCLHVGHIVDRADGGPNALHNLRVECAGCNLSKAAARTNRLRWGDGPRSKQRRRVSFVDAVGRPRQRSREW